MEEEQTKQPFLNRKKLQTICAAILAVALMVAVLILFSPRKTAPIDRFYRSLQKGTAEDLLKCLPEQALEFASEKYDAEVGTGTLRGYLSALTSELHESMAVQYGEKLKISFRVTNKKDYDNEQLHRLALLLEEMYGLDPVTVTEACEITVDTTCKGSLSKETTQGDIFIVYRFNGKWYLLFDPLSGT